MTERDPVTDEELERFVDARLEPERRAAVAEHLVRHPETAEEVEAHRRLNARLRARFDPVLAESIPSSLLRTAARGSMAAAPRPRKAHRLASGIVLAVLFGAVGGWLWRDLWPDPPTPSVFVEQAAYAHRVFAPDRVRPVEVGADRERELIAWLSEHLGDPVKAPALGSLGFRLIGGRVLPASGGPAAQLMYENGSGGRITLYLRTDLPNWREVEFEFAREDGVGVLYWLDGRRGYALSGDLDRSTLQRIAKVVYEELGS